MTKRTKRYGGFHIGDRVYPKDKKDWRLDEGNVIQLQNGKVFAQFYDCGFTNPVIAFMPNQLINFTRIEEENRKITDPLPPKQEEQEPTVEEMSKWLIENFSEDWRIMMSSSCCTSSELQDRIRMFYYAKKAEYDKIEEFRLKPIKDFVNEALRQTEIFLSPLTPYGDPLPSPYTRDVYSFSKDF